MDIHPKLGIGIEVALTRLHAGSKFGEGGYKVSEAFMGRVSAVNAISSFLEVTVKKDGGLYFIRFECGKTVTPLEKIGKAKGTGTLVRFMPDLTYSKLPILSLV